MEYLAVVQLLLRDRAALDTMLATGVDLAEYVRESEAGVEVHAIVTASEMAALERQGARIEKMLWGPADWKDRVAERDATVAVEKALRASADRVEILRACCLDRETGGALHVEARSNAGILPDVILTASWDAGKGTAIGSGGTAFLARKMEGGTYVAHSLTLPVSARPAQLRVTSSLGGAAEATVTDDERDGEHQEAGQPYAEDFTSHYMHPTEVYDRIEALARDFPDLAEIITLPFQTNGYQRNAQALLGTDPEATVVVTSKVSGHKGGNALSIEVIAPRAPRQPLTVTVTSNHISVQLGTDAAGRTRSTASQVIAALNDGAGELVAASAYRGHAGTALVRPQGTTRLTENLGAPASISREPFPVKAIRIGTRRDGRRPGFMVYAQEHAREWVAPLVAVEVAERLLRNYAQDRQTAQLVDELDIFIIPCANPDGAHYSFFDYGMQRKNMVYHDGTVHSDHADPGFRNFWGVDPNRNAGVGSLFDGYLGASANCLSQTYAGPAELSEAESRNLVWLAGEYPHVHFALNIHSYGGYVMWPPGAYKGKGREVLERPAQEQEAFFRTGAAMMVAAIKERRGTVIPPQNIGAAADVLYSAAGNSSDHLWYERGIFAWEVEVGAGPVGFQPPFDEGHAEVMEFADGLLALLHFAGGHDRGIA